MDRCDTCCRELAMESDLGLRFFEQDRLEGRVEMDSERQEPILVVDGRPRSLSEIGRLLLSYEGWRVGIEILDSIEETPDVPEPGGLTDQVELLVGGSQDTGQPKRQTSAPLQSAPKNASGPAKGGLPLVIDVAAPSSPLAD